MDAAKTVFISHSSLDQDIAHEICSILESQGLSCWIAPRDIPYGADLWAQEIGEAILASDVMLILLTEHSNARPQHIIREINMAMNHNIKLIPIRMTEQPMNPALEYYISVSQGVSMTFDSLPADSLRLAQGLLGQKNQAVACIPEEEPRLVGNLDQELDARFAELFEGISSGKSNPVEENPFRKKLLDRIAENVLNHYGDHCHDWLEPSNSPEEPYDEKPKSKFFTLTEHEGNTVVYIVRKRYLLPDYRAEFHAERTDCAIELKEDGSRLMTFFCENCEPGGNPLVVLTFLPDRGLVMVNMGFLDFDVMKLSKKPMFLHYQQAPSGENQEDLRMELNPDGRNIVLDPATTEELPRQKYFDPKQNRWIHYVDLKQKQIYFAFNIRKHQDPDQPLSRDDGYPDASIAKGYYFGCYGLKKNNLEAAVWFEKAATAESWYYLGRIFTEDPLLASPEDAAYWFRKALEGGEKRAEKYL